MSNNKKVPATMPPPEAKASPTKTAATTVKQVVPAAPTPALKVPGLFRNIDWLTFGVTTLLTFIGYLLTISPQVGLEDSGELAVASMYAGVPHPPGYPVWTIYTWLFTVLFPVSNIAYR